MKSMAASKSSSEISLLPSLSTDALADCTLTGRVAIASETAWRTMPFNISASIEYGECEEGSISGVSALTMVAERELSLLFSFSQARRWRGLFRFKRTVKLRRFSLFKGDTPFAKRLSS